MRMEWKDPTNTVDTAREEARQRIEARRVAREKRQRRNRIVSTTALAAATLCLGIILGARITTTESREPTPSAPMLPEAAVTAALPEPEAERPVATVPPGDAEPVAYQQPEDTEPPEWVVVDGRVMSDATPTLLPSAQLDKETQWMVYSLCGSDNRLFCAVMAIGYHESRFKTDAVGDDGRSVGWLQINAKWHKERMERLGVTDLTDPIQCATVAIDYIKELAESFGDVGGHPLYIAYNAGPSQARELLQSGTTSTGYSREVLALYHSYLTEMEAQG